MRVAYDVGRNDRFLRGGKDPLPARFSGRLLKYLVNLLCSCFSLCYKSDVYNRAGNHWHAQGNAVKLAGKIFVRFGNRHRRAS